MRYVRIFRAGAIDEIERQVNNLAEKEKVEIIAANTIINQGVFYMTVIFEEKKATVKTTKTAKTKKI